MNPSSYLATLEQLAQSSQPANPKASRKASPKGSRPVSSSHATDLFLFLEIFACEGGIQSYVQDIFRGLAAAQQSADVFLLRDAKFENPFASEHLRFRYFKQASPRLGRFRFTAHRRIAPEPHRPSLLDRQSQTLPETASHRRQPDGNARLALQWARSPQTRRNQQRPDRQ